MSSGTLPRSIFLTSLLVLLLSGITACGAESPWLSGKVLATRSGTAHPISEARVMIVPLLPLKNAKEFREEDPGRLRGLATTQSSGTFEVTTLSSPVTHQEYELLRNWRYRIEIEVPGYYITSAEFDYAGGNNYLEIKIEEKLLDVEDDSGGIGEDDHPGPTDGSVRRN